MKTALYVRVSTEEQAMNGISVDAQLNELREYAKNHNYVIYDEYIDAGFSGGLLHRPALDKLLNDAKNKCFEIVIFVKLDRWFRSVPHYYKIQEILESNNINWIATQEDYETLTSSGKFKVNIMLSVSQQFKDATSERIKSVFDYKLAITKQVRTGSTPYGYKIENKQYVVDDEKSKHIIELFEYAYKTKSFRATHRWWISKYDKIGYNALCFRLKDKRYIGIYEKNGISYKDYYPPIVDETLFMNLQNTINSHKMKKQNTFRDYLFTGIIVCGECGCRYTGMFNTNRYLYRCNREKQGLCKNHSIGEKKIEQYILDELPTHAKYEFDKITANKKPVKDNSKQIREKQNRLKELYIEGLLNKDEFQNKYDSLEKQIVIDPPKMKKQNIDILLNGMYIDLYNKLDKKHQSLFFKEYIDKIIIYKNGDIKIKLIEK